MAQVIDSVAHLAWPVIIAFCAIKIGPSLRDIISQRDVRAKGGPGGLELEVGGQPISAQRAVDDQRKETEALRAQFSLLAAQVDVLAATSTASVPGGLEADPRLVPGAPGTLGYANSSDAPLTTRRVLWVDDEPQNNAYEIAALQDRGVEVVQSASTRDAIFKLAQQGGFDAVITDMGRFESGHLRSTAGLDLLTWIEQSGPSVPVVVYTSRHGAHQHGAKALEAGAIGATASATELFELLGVNFGPLSGLRLESEVLRAVREGQVEEVQELHHRGPVDAIVRLSERTVGVEIKAWLQTPSPSVVNDVLARLSNLVDKGEFDEVWLITSRPIPGRKGTDDGTVLILTLEELREHLRAC
jgi:CheY-like chemotaxis protein